MPCKALTVLLFSFWSGLSSGSLAEPLHCRDQGYRVGAGQHDITGPIAEVGLLGYADLTQRGEGLHMRLRSRALVISDACGESTIGMVIADIGIVFHSIKHGVLEELNKELPGVFSHRNLLFSATHTHAAPGGFAHHALYNISTLGFHPESFKATVLGTVQSIVKAYRQQQAARLLIARGELHGAQYNRSPQAYAANPVAEKAVYGDNVDPEMLQIQAFAEDGRALAVFNWFALHGVSLPIENKYVSGDNKGLAAYKFEKKMGATYQKSGEFVAGFVQANSGDISPYDVSRPIPRGINPFPRNEQAADLQFQKSYELFEHAEEELDGPLEAVHSFVDVAYREVSATFTGQGPKKTCNGTLGVSFAAGTENGQPVSIFREGSVFGGNWPKITIMPEEQVCHGEKVILFPTGFVRPDPWTARIVPFQVLRIGQLAIIATPFEVTTMAGRRLKKAMLETLAPAGIKYVAITALANEYIHYVTTPEEYRTQHYEGGSTLYGPWSLPAYTEIFAGLGAALRDDRAVDPGNLPPDLSNKQMALNPGVLGDSVPIRQHFGAVKLDAKGDYQAGEPVAIEFWGAHPNNSQGRDSTLLTVEHLEADRWTAVRDDSDPDTFYHWKRHGLAQSIITVRWDTPSNQNPGIYRLCHQGHSKAFFTGKLKAYRSCSKNFVITP